VPELFVADWIDEEGLPRRQREEAPSRAAAYSRLPEGARQGLQRLAPLDRGPTLGPLAEVSRYLARLTRQGVPLAEALRLWGAGGLERAAARAAEGAGVADALAAEGGVFASAPVQALLSGGEGGFSFPMTLDAIADVATGLERSRRNVWEGLSYPILVATLGSLLAALAVTLAAGLVTPVTLDVWAQRPTLVSRAIEFTFAHPWAPWVASLALSVTLWTGWFAAPRWWASSLRGARCRNLFALRLLGGLCAHGVPSPSAWAALATTLRLPGAHSLAEGGGLGNALRAAGLVSELEALGLQAAEQGGVTALAEELDALAKERLEDEAARARFLGFLLETLLLIGLAVGVLVAGMGAVSLGFV
jgi:type II secretory pathway component PulF